jgi:ATP-dependent DNA helicase RecG
MTVTELLELVANGENSFVEFKRDDVAAKDLAREVVALLNHKGGRVLLGVDDDKTIVGIQRDETHERVEDFVMTAINRWVRPQILPSYEEVRFEDGRRVGVLSVDMGVDKPYYINEVERELYYVRVGSHTNLADRNAIKRMLQASGALHYEITPVQGGKMSLLDPRRIQDYIYRVRPSASVAVPAWEDTREWERILVNTSIMAPSEVYGPVVTVGGLLLFGNDPHQLLRQSGIHAVAFRGTQKEYDSVERALLNAPLVPMYDSKNPTALLEKGLLQIGLDFVSRHCSREGLKEGIRIRTWDYPEEAVREALANALLHRDYTLTGALIELLIYSDRLEIVSPGNLPNTVTVERMKAGYRCSRNQFLVDVGRDYGIVEQLGLGIRNKILASFQKLGRREPDFVAEEFSFKLVFWKE